MNITLTSFMFFFSDDKMILKVVSNSEALLALVELEPEFVSQNEHDAQIEGDVMFPLGYVSVSEEEFEANMKLDDEDPFGEDPDQNEEKEDEGQNNENDISENKT